MNTQLAKALIDRGIITYTTRIIAHCPVRAMGDAPAEQRLALTVNRIVYDNQQMKFITTHSSGRKYSVPVEKIEMIDGMHPVRLAAAYDIKDTGNKKPAGKKRGRKPKVVQ